MTVDDYDNQQIGPEQFLWRSNDTLIYAKNVKDSYIISEGKGDCLARFTALHLLIARP